MLNLIPVFVILYLATHVNAGSNAGGTATITVNTRPDIARRLNAVGLTSYGVQINCQKANSITSQSEQYAIKPILPFTTITAPGCSTDTAWGGKPGSFETFHLFMYGLNGKKVLCGEFRGTGRRDSDPIISLEMNGCPNFDIPVLAPLMPSLLPSLLPGSLPIPLPIVPGSQGGAIVPGIQGGVVLPALFPSGQAAIALGKFDPSIIQNQPIIPIAKGLSPIIPVSKGFAPIIQSLPAYPVQPAYPIQPAYSPPVIQSAVAPGYPVGKGVLPAFLPNTQNAYSPLKNAYVPGLQTRALGKSGYPVDLSLYSRKY